MREFNLVLDCIQLAGFFFFWHFRAFYFVLGNFVKTVTHPRIL